MVFQCTTVSSPCRTVYSLSSENQPVDSPPGWPLSYNVRSSSEKSLTLNSPATGTGLASSTIFINSNSECFTRTSFASLQPSDHTTRQHLSGPKRLVSSSSSFLPGPSLSTARIILFNPLSWDSQFSI